ncbi:diacylglycerol kinase [Streptomyces sp. NPDC048606]|uniref:diacylglycerol kinase n=1 Tax=Streptomyces sp. NPDC048606 TaxID=3154726 RepID=UPI0034454953
MDARGDRRPGRGGTARRQGRRGSGRHPQPGKAHPVRPEPTRRPVKDVTVLTNPAAGSGRAAGVAGAAVARLRELGVRTHVEAGTDPRDALRRARAAVDRGVDALVVVGGDGMAALAVQALAGTDVPLGVVPAGTGNDVARQYGLPRGNPGAAAEVVAAGRTLRVDTGLVETADGTSRYFVSVLAIGFDSLVSDRANRMRRPRGRARYNIAMLRELAGLRPLPFRLVLDGGREVIARDLALASVGNSRSYGGGMLICPDADPCDGLLDLTLVDAMPRARLVRFFPTVFTGGHVRRSEVTTRRTTSLRVESPGINVYADGDHVGPLPAEIRVVPRSLSLLVPD